MNIHYKQPFFLVVIALLALLSIGIVWFSLSRNKSEANQIQSNPVSATSTSAKSQMAISRLYEPVLNFKQRITKKPFGIYISPQNSPVQPERFTGFHTGADAEYEDTAADVPVYAIADGTIVLSETASGYGGVFMLQVVIDDSKQNVLYGHIRPSSLPEIGATFSKGQQIGLLGTSGSIETGGERRHLHFAILSDASLEIKGYVTTKAELSGWINPLNFF